jgi:two-component system KDP operon response regulator KdpE
VKILVIEDDKTIIDSISLIFQLSWPETKLISTPLGQKGIELAETEHPDVVILDLGLPDISGYEVLKQIRLFSAVPVIILTVRSEEVDIVRGLEGGADDYIIKPFRQLELLSRIRCVTRRQERVAQEKPLELGQFYFNPTTWQLVISEREISVTRTEGSIFYHLLQNAGRVVTHSDLAEALWGVDYPDAADCLRVHIRRLRVKIEEDPRQPQVILTKPGVGYLFAKPD